MKNSTNLFFFSLAFFMIAFVSSSSAQFQVSINQSDTGANDCARTLTAQPQNGSGNYSYLWTITTPGITFPGTNNTQTVNLGISQTVDVLVTVTDNSTSNTAQTTTTVHRVLLGNFDIFIPNLITPNGDGYNDEWVITDSNQGITPINAYSYSVTVKNSSNTVVYSTSGTVSSNYLGILGGDISWNARLNGTGSIVPAGVYDYSLTLVNCSQTTVYSGQLVIFI